MKKILGFGYGTKGKKNVLSTAEEKSAAAKTLVSVRFINDGRCFTYYNDSFELSVGDCVFVSGKLSGQLGIVEKVTGKFKINLADYEKVISKASCELHGNYEAVLDKMLSYDDTALSPEDFRRWILPPRESGKAADDEIVIGEGYELSLSELEEADEIIPSVLERAVDYCEMGRVAYIGVRNGVGKAYVLGTKWYEIDFVLSGDRMSEIYCDCPYPGLCKHLLAVAMTIRALGLDGSRNVTAIDKTHFWSMVSRSMKKISL